MGWVRDKPRFFAVGVTSKRYHSPDCAVVRDAMNGPSKPHPLSHADAKAMHYQPCGACKPSPLMSVIQGEGQDDD